MNHLVLATVILAIITIQGEAEMKDPIIEGKPYSTWLDMLESWRKRPAAHPQVEDAIKRAGSEGFDLLLSYLGTNALQTIDRSSDSDAHDKIKVRRDRAVMAIHILGEQAQGLIPPLLTLLNGYSDPEARRDVASALGQIPSRSGDLIKAAFADLNSEMLEYRVDALLVLSGITDTDAILDRVIKNCVDPEPKVRAYAIFVLGKHLDSPRARAVITDIALHRNGFGLDVNDRIRARIILRPDYIQTRPPVSSAIAADTL